MTEGIIFLPLFALFVDFAYFLLRHLIFVGYLGKDNVL